MPCSRVKVQGRLCSPAMRGSIRGAAEGARRKQAELAPSGPPPPHRGGGENTPYQTFTRFSGGRYILSPGFTSKAAYQSSRFRTVKARYWSGAWPSVMIC